MINDKKYLLLIQPAQTVFYEEYDPFEGMWKPPEHVDVGVAYRPLTTTRRIEVQDFLDDPYTVLAELMVL